MKISAILWLEKPINNFMIRFGHLKAIAFLAQEYTTTLKSIEKSLYNIYTSKTKVNLKQNIHIVEYIYKKALYGQKNRYNDLIIEKKETTYSIHSLLKKNIENYPVELQDLFLADPKLPSKLGALSPNVFNEVVNWSVWMGILNPQRHTRTAWGTIIKTLSSMTASNYFSEYDKSKNIFFIKAERPALFFLLLLKDGGFINIFYQELLNEFNKNVFSRDNAVFVYLKTLRFMNNFYEALRHKFTYIKKIRILREQINRIEKEITRFQRERKRMIEGIMRVSPRLELLVDLNLLYKPDPFLYSFSLTDRTLKFIELLKKYDFLKESNEFFYRNFFSFYNELFELNAKLITDPEEILRIIIQENAKIRKGVGNRRIFEYLIFAISNSIERDRLYFEIQDGFNALMNGRKKYPEDVFLYGGKEHKKIEYMRFSTKIVKKFA